MKEPKINEVLLKIKHTTYLKKFHKIKTYKYNVLISKLLLMKIINLKRYLT